MLTLCDEFRDCRWRILISRIADRFERNHTFCIEMPPTSSWTLAHFDIMFKMAIGLEARRGD